MLERKKFASKMCQLWDNDRHSSVVHIQWYLTINYAAKCNLISDTYNTGSIHSYTYSR